MITGNFLLRFSSIRFIAGVIVKVYFLSTVVLPPFHQNMQSGNRLRVRVDLTFVVAAVSPTLVASNQTGRVKCTKKLKQTKPNQTKPNFQGFPGVHYRQNVCHYLLLFSLNCMLLLYSGKASSFKLDRCEIYRIIINKHWIHFMRQTIYESLPRPYFNSFSNRTW